MVPEGRHVGPLRRGGPGRLSDLSHYSGELWSEWRSVEGRWRGESLCCCRAGGAGAAVQGSAGGSEASWQHHQGIKGHLTFIWLTDFFIVATG